jgi:2-polyprenyl-3-methyl-5-hydroxy-6-metoxy-1,4-benzoquinol methylase
MAAARDRMELRTVTVYDMESIDPEAANTSHALVLELVGRDRRVLDVGCSTGYLGKVLADRGCVVDGVEIDAEAADLAREHLHTVTEIDLDRDDLAQALAGAQYDCIVMADVLEHLTRPEAVLESAISLLAPGGEVVISVPNVTHGSLRLALMQGRWDYRDTGLLDRTHIRFFTRDSILFESRALS